MNMHREMPRHVTRMTHEQAYGVIDRYKDEYRREIGNFTERGSDDPFLQVEAALWAGHIDGERACAEAKRILEDARGASSDGELNV